MDSAAFRFDKRDEGFMVFAADGRGVASIDAATISFDHDPKYVNPQRVETVLPRDKWRVHFCAAKLTVPELAEFLSAIPKEF